MAFSMASSKRAATAAGSKSSTRTTTPAKLGLAGRRRVLQTNAFFDFLKPKPPPAPVKVVRPTVIPAPSYNIPIALAAISAAELYEGWSVVAAVTGVLAVFLTVQASRVKFIFDDEALEIVIGEQQKQTVNVVVGGQNRWTYDSFINWELWFPAFPVLVYFKESQTKPEGQIHFFPLIFDGKAVYDVMVERCGPSKGSLPK